MARAEDVIKVAMSQVGYSAMSDPERGSKYGRWLASVFDEDWLAGPSTEIWWCCMFVSWCLDQAGQKCVGFPSYNTDLVLGKRPTTVPKEQAMPGDIVIWNWDGNSTTDHIGIVSEHVPGQLGRLITVEGNVGNAVKVCDRTGTWGLVAAVIRPPYDDAKVILPQPVTEGQIEVDGLWGRETTAALQRHFGTVVDGEVWHQWPMHKMGALVGGWGWDYTQLGSPLIRAMQEWLGVTADGLIGPVTVRALQARMGVEQTGYLNAPAPAIVKLQDALNKGTL